VYKVVICYTKNQKTKFLVLMCLSVSIVAGLSSAICIGSANAQNTTVMEDTAKGDATKLNIALVHGIWFDASSWSKVIPRRWT
jgi:hypothetical protein